MKSFEIIYDLRYSFEWNKEKWTNLNSKSVYTLLSKDETYFSFYFFMSINFKRFYSFRLKRETQARNNNKRQNFICKFIRGEQFSNKRKWIDIVTLNVLLNKTTTRSFWLSQWKISFIRKSFGTNSKSNCWIKSLHQSCKTTLSFSIWTWVNKRRISFDLYLYNGMGWN